MKSALQVGETKVSTVGFQEASMDIWDKKYRLKSKNGEVVDESMDYTDRRIAESPRTRGRLRQPRPQPFPAFGIEGADTVTEGVHGGFSIENAYILTAVRSLCVNGLQILLKRIARLILFGVNMIGRWIIVAHRISPLRL